MFHLEIRQFPHKLARFNLSEAQLRAIVEPFAAEKWIEVGERKWNPREAKLTILEGPELPVEELAINRGWKAALRQSADVTERIMELATTAAEEAARRALEEAGRAALAADAVAAGGATGEAVDAGEGVDAGGAPVDGGGATAGGAGGSKAVPNAPAASVLSDPLTLGVQLAALLGSDPAALLEAWRAVATGASGLAPSESLAVAERRLAGDDRGGG